ncbi:MAG: DUF4124 domain-containing protein [Shewanella sp.]|uniref:DUF4124 domain-containing protein n=1 Tax=Shewanella sp. TaxID=50422 RepID=UPI003F2AADB6
MVKFIAALAWMMLPTTTFAASQVNTIYKCRKDDKVVFSQTACPAEYRQHKIEYQFGIPTEIDSDKRDTVRDPLQILLQQSALPQEQWLQLLDAEIYRLRQEISYFEILKASEIQALERKRYWQDKPKEDQEYLTGVTKVTEHFDRLTAGNRQIIELLEARKRQFLAEPAPTLAPAQDSR